jgi:hypothetical protein
MARVAYVDRQYLAHRSAAVHIAELPVVRIDGAAVGNGVTGPLARRLRECYLAHAASVG